MQNPYKNLLKQGLTLSVLDFRWLGIGYGNPGRSYGDCVHGNRSRYKYLPNTEATPAVLQRPLMATPRRVRRGPHALARDTPSHLRKSWHKYRGKDPDLVFSGQSWSPPSPLRYYCPIVTPRAEPTYSMQPRGGDSDILSYIVHERGTSKTFCIFNPLVTLPRG